MDPCTRRQLLANASLMAASGLAASATAQDKSAQPSQLKVLVAGAHPGDPEAGCGGTIARYVAQGHLVSSALPDPRRSGDFGQVAR